MSRLVKKLKSGQSVIFDQGRFDEWCVYVVEPNGSKKAPYDETYFSELYEISKHYPKGKVYNDFVKIYNLTGRSIDHSVVSIIDEISRTYLPEHQNIIEKWFSVIYAGMIAEENKERAILKKRIKRLGMYQVLMLDMPAKEAAKFSYGKKWRELDEIMKKYGF